MSETDQRDGRPRHLQNPPAAGRCQRHLTGAATYQKYHHTARHQLCLVQKNLDQGTDKAAEPECVKVIHAHTSICSMTTPWAIPGILSPSLKLTLERSALLVQKDPLPFSGYNLRKDVGGKDYSRTAAAASSCVGVLRRIVIDQDTAVFMNGRKPDILFLQKI